MPNRYDPPGFRVLGKRWELAVTVVDKAGTPVDLTGATIAGAIGASAGVLPFASKESPDADIAIANQATNPGEAVISFLPNETGDFVLPESGQVYYQVDVNFGGGYEDSVASGFIRVVGSLI